MVYKLKVQDPFSVNAPVTVLHFGTGVSPQNGGTRCVRLSPPLPAPLRTPSIKAGGCGAATGGEGCCHFKMPADWSVNMDKRGADSWVRESVSERERAHAGEILTSGPVVKIRKSKQRSTPIYTPFIYFLQKYTEKIIKRFNLSSLFVCFFLFFFLKVSKVYI